MSRLRFSIISGVAAGLLFGAVAAWSQALRQAFPHEKHEKLFPVCEGCHAGVATGDSGTIYPAVADCATCHDGTRVKLVEWRAPGARLSTLRFSHVDHFAVTDTMNVTAGDVTCKSCHATNGEGKRMDVGAPRPALCVECHTNDSREHLASTAVCGTCHLPLAGAPDLPAERVAGFPRPPWHDTLTFASEHGRESERRTATCAVCHARNTCERCHANGDRLSLVTALSRDGRVALLEKEKMARYLTPASHRDTVWRSTHGAEARATAASCANCHTRPSCAACHLDGTGRAGSVIATLPAARRGAAPGVSPDLIESDIHPSDIASSHGTLASTGKLQCTECHAARTCSSCHAGATSRGVHAANFVERHAVDVFAGSANCQSCHNTERFCRDCHTKTGTAATGRMDAAFHTGQPMWVLAHGQAARRGMESCAACHRQADCVRCHSAAGGWGVNPHGPGFPASRLAARNAGSCRWCHTGGIGAGGGE